MPRMLPSTRMASPLPAYRQALRTEVLRVEALAARPVQDFEADPRLCEEASLRLGRLLDAIRDVAVLELKARRRIAPGATSPHRAPDWVAEHGLPGSARRLALHALSRHRDRGGWDLGELTAERLHRALVAASGRLREP